MRYYFILCSLLLMSCQLEVPAFEEVQITDTKIIRLPHFPQAEREFADPSDEPELDYSKGLQDFDGVGMNNVPVLDQGQYGTCVTFSTTAALDAIIGKGDFVSQQCSLDLDMGLGHNYWNGAKCPFQIVSPLQKYGIISKDKCPRKYPVPNFSFSSAKYKKLIDPVASDAVKKVQVKYSPSPSLDALKQAIDAKHRVLIGFTVDSSSKEAVRGFDIIINEKQFAGGLWACQQGVSKNHCVSSNAGHEVLVYAYDDAQQLLKIRNSWNVDVGEDGNYFMTYKFFETMAMDQTEIW